MENTNGSAPMADSTIQARATIINPSLMELVPRPPLHGRHSREPVTTASTMVRAKLRAHRSPYSSDTAMGSTKSAASISTTRPRVNKTIL